MLFPIFFQFLLLHQSITHAENKMSNDTSQLHHFKFFEDKQYQKYCYVNLNNINFDQLEFDQTYFYNKESLSSIENEDYKVHNFDIKQPLHRELKNNFLRKRYVPCVRSCIQN